jgi:hypothetical protein
LTASARATLQSTDGFFSMVTPRMDAVEEITVTGAVPGVGAGAGSVQIAFVTRSGSNQFDERIYHYWRDPVLNSNYYFNKSTASRRTTSSPPVRRPRVAVPIVLPGYDGRGKAFFFVELRTPVPAVVGDAHAHDSESVARGHLHLRPQVVGVTTQQTVNVLALAAYQQPDHDA